MNQLNQEILPSTGLLSPGGGRAEGGGLDFASLGFGRKEHGKIIGFPLSLLTWSAGRMEPATIDQGDSYCSFCKACSTVGQ
jgi:hypothetical protein